jgi:predicted dehydrogenase
MPLWLIGAGAMAQDYAKVLLACDQHFVVVGRGQLSASLFEEKVGCEVTRGGLESALQTEQAPRQAIVAVGVEQLASTAVELIKAGTKHILLEKPGGINLPDIESLDKYASEYGAEVLIAYNRRFYGSVKQARQRIFEDGGITSALFEFTEWSHVIAPLQKVSGVKEHWVLANSSHVIDLAFHLIGHPMDWKCWHSGSIDWHPTASRFAGAGVTDQNVIFSYMADWQAPGRWGVELLTAKHRLILRPMEQLQVIQLGTVTAEVVQPEDSFDRDYKPGLYRQTRAFLEGDYQLFCNLSDHIENVRTYSKMAGYL